MPPADAAVKEEKVEKAEEAKQVKKGQEIEEVQVDLNDPDLFLNRELRLLDF